MTLRCIAAVTAALSVAACDNSVKLRGTADDGETFNGIAIGTGAFDQSGTLQVVSNRGLNCVGTYQFEGLAGPKGKATMNCSDGSTAGASLDMNTRRGAGTIGDRKLTFAW